MAQTKKAPSLPVANVQISIPSGNMWYGRFAMCVIQMILDSYTYETPGWKIGNILTRNIKGSTIWRQRAELIQGALDTDCTHMLFIDVDQVFPANTLRRLLSHNKPIVAANVAVKQWPSMPTARAWREGEAKPIFTTEDSKGLEKVWRVGTGIMFIDLSIMEKVEKPWFKVSWGDESYQYGEDWWFCQQIEKAGYPIYIDHDLSWEVGHIGDFQYQHWHIPQEIREETERIFSEGTEEEQRHVLGTATKRMEDKAIKAQQDEAIRDLMQHETAGQLQELKNAKV